MSSVPKTVLVTGGNGYLGSAVIHHFLQHGYRVHTTVRSLAKADGLKGYLYPKYESSLSFFVVENMTKDGVYEQSKALEGVDAILHVASPVPDVNNLAPSDSADWVRDMVNPAIDGTLTVLRAASKFPRVKYVITTSSGAALQPFAALTDPKLREQTLTEADWNTTKADDEGLKSNPFAAYFASKTCAERAAWDYVREQKPHWKLATFCPPIFWGPGGTQPNTPAEFGSSLGMFYQLTLGSAPVFPLDGDWVDVRDIAQAFRLVIEKPLGTSERFVLANGSQKADEVVTFATSGDSAVLHDLKTRYDTTKARQLLGWEPKPKKETLVDMLAYLKEAEKGFSK